MNTIYIIIITVLVVGGLLLLMKFVPGLPAKVWAYIGLGVSALIGIVYLVARLWPKKTPTVEDPVMKPKADQLKEDLNKVHADAEAQIAAARAVSASVDAEVIAIQHISDEEERLAKLADLFNRTRR